MHNKYQHLQENHLYSFFLYQTRKVHPSCEIRGHCSSIPDQISLLSNEVLETFRYMSISLTLAQMMEVGVLFQGKQPSEPVSVSGNNSLYLSIHWEWHLEIFLSSPHPHVTSEYGHFSWQWYMICDLMNSLRAFTKTALTKRESILDHSNSFWCNLVPGAKLLSFFVIMSSDH